MNVTFGMIEDTTRDPIRDKARRRESQVARALAAIEEYGRRSGSPAGRVLTA